MGGTAPPGRAGKPTLPPAVGRPGTRGREPVLPGNDGFHTPFVAIHTQNSQKGKIADRSEQNRPIQRLDQAEIIPRMAYDEELANRIRELVAGEDGVVEKKMFGGLAFLIGGNMSVSASGRGGLLLRVDPGQTGAPGGDPYGARL